MELNLTEGRRSGNIPHLHHTSSPPYLISTIPHLHHTSSPPYLICGTPHLHHTSSPPYLISTIPHLRHNSSPPYLMSTIPNLHHTPSWQGEGQLYICVYSDNHFILQILYERIINSVKILVTARITRFNNYNLCVLPTQRINVIFWFSEQTEMMYLCSIN